MTVSDKKLARMAEQIAANMNYGEDTDVVAGKVAQHINLFWDERMKSAFKVYASTQQENFSVELQAAVSKLE